MLKNEFVVQAVLASPDQVRDNRYIRLYAWQNSNKTEFLIHAGKVPNPSFRAAEPFPVAFHELLFLHGMEVICQKKGLSE
jgi:hypothetical protein